MHFGDIIYLISQSPTFDGDGYPTTSAETSREVFANVKSVTRGEFYASLKSGINMTIAFNVRSVDYQNEKIIEHDSKRYKVIRTYIKDGEIMELNCSDLAV